MLENSVNIDLATSINDRTYEPGYRVVKYLNFRTKINILKDDYVYFIKAILSSKKTKDNLLEETKIIFSKLQELSEFRNKVAHADWTSLDKKGFVVTKIKEDYNGDGMYLEKIKMTPAVINKFTRQNQAVANRLNIFRDKVWEASQKEDVKRRKKAKS